MQEAIIVWICDQKVLEVNFPNGKKMSEAIMWSKLHEIL